MLMYNDINTYAIICISEFSLSLFNFLTEVQQAPAKDWGAVIHCNISHHHPIQFCHASSASHLSFTRCKLWILELCSRIRVICPRLIGNELILQDTLSSSNAKRRQAYLADDVGTPIIISQCSICANVLIDKISITE